MARYRQLMREVEAEQYDGSAESVQRIMDMAGTSGFNNCPEGLFISRNNEVLMAQKGDYVVMEPSGNAYPCFPEVFESFYERID